MEECDKEYVLALLVEKEKATTIAFSAQEKLMHAHFSSIWKRLDTMNEFRGQLEAQAASFVTRRELMWALSTVVALAGVIVAGLVATR